MRLWKTSEQISPDLGTAHVEGVEVRGCGARPRCGVAGGLGQGADVPRPHGGRHVRGVEVGGQRPCHCDPCEDTLSCTRERGVTRGHGGVDRGGGGARGHYRMLGHLKSGHDDCLGAVIPGLVGLVTRTMC